MLSLEQLQRDLQHPDWYIRLEDYMRSEIFPVIHDEPEIQQRRHAFYGLVEEMLSRGEIPLAKSGPNLDADRKDPSAIVIHHTEEDPDISLGRLSAIGFVRQYALHYLEGTIDDSPRGKPIWSGHFRDGHMVFFAYHWLIRTDGTAERLLDDTYIGWHSLHMNPSSIGLSFSGNYEHSRPTNEQISGAARVINGHYGHIAKERILGHCEVMENRTCPGDKFLGGWKDTLLGQLRR